MSATDDDELAWLAAEKRLIAEAADAEIPFLVFASGVQLLAASLGARVYAGSKPEVGLLPVTLTDAALADPVFAGLPREFVTLQWHGDTFELPEHAVRLAGSPVYPNQAFRYRRAYGVQFHLEVSPEMAAEWARVPAYEESLRSTLGAEGAADFFAEFAEHADSMRSKGRALFERWLDTSVVVAEDPEGQRLASRPGH